MKHAGFAVLFIAFVCWLAPDTLWAQDQPKASQLIESTLGIGNKWASTRYLLYTVDGPTVSPGIASERTFLIDKTSGDCRFEGTNSDKENIVLLFNFNTRKLKKLFVNRKESKENADALFDNVVNQFFMDTQLLFLPAFLSEEPSRVTDVTEKMISSEKMPVISFSNLPAWGGKNVRGKIAVTHKGAIKSITIDNAEYRTSGSKDIGGGIVLSTVFEGRDVYKFLTVAAFTQMEIGKFTDF